MSKPDWVKGCTVCTLGMTEMMHDLIQNKSTEIAAARAISKLAGIDEFGDQIISPEAVKSRYRRTIGTQYSHPPKKKEKRAPRTLSKKSFRA